MALKAYAEYDTKMQKMVWDPKTTDIRVKSVEKTLEPLVRQVTTLVNHENKKQGFRKGRPSKKASQLVKDIEIAITHLVQIGEGVAHDFPEIKQLMLAACEEASVAGDKMKGAASEFATDPCTPAKRNVMVRAARALLSAVTRLLCIADMGDVFRILLTLRKVEDKLKELEIVNTPGTLLTTFKDYGDNLTNLARLTGIRQADIIDLRHKDEMASARATLKSSSRMLLTSSQAFVNHPDLQSAQKNRDYVVNQVNSAVATIADVAQASGESEKHPYEEAGFLIQAFEELSAQLDREPEDYHNTDNQDDLQTLVEDIVSGASILADSVCTRDKTREKIYSGCHHVKTAVNNLLDEYENHENNDVCDVQRAKNSVERKAENLTKQLRKSVVDHVSDSFLETNVPLVMLIEAAESGNGREVDECSNMFMAHAEKLQKVSDLACSMSGDAERIKIAKITSNQLCTLSPEVVNAAHTLADRPKSKAAQENLEVFRDAWLYQVRILTDAVDDITTIDDFLSVSEAHVLEDINHCIEAMQNKEPEILDRTAGAVRIRIARLEHVVLSEMENYESSHYTSAVKKTVDTMKKTIMSEFADYIDIAVDALTQNRPEDVDEDMFFDISQLVHEGMRDIRKAVAMRNPMSESDLERDEDINQQPSLLSQIVDAQTRQQEKLAYEQLTAGGKVQFEVHSDGQDDPGYNGLSSIIVNGVEYCTCKQGHNVVVLDQCGTVVKTENFDTTQHKEGVTMSKFLHEIPEDHIVLIAVQGTGGEYVKESRDALKKLGATEPIESGYGSSWAFVGYKGDYRNKRFVSLVTRPRYQGPSMISDMINTPAADMGKIRVEIFSEGCEDGGYTRTASVKINSIERSPMGRGMNIMVLDNAGNYLLSKNFDTVHPNHAINEGKRMSKFLDGLPNKRIVAIASLESVGEGFDETKDAVLRLGGQNSLFPGMNGSFAFLGYTGPHDVDWLKQVCHQRAEGPSQISEYVLTPAAVDEIFKEHRENDGKGSMSPEARVQRVLSSENAEVNQSARSLMRCLPQEEKVKINKLNDGLILEKNRLISEVDKWDEQGNEIIVLAKKMCMIMMDMSDFTRGTGPLKTTMDVVRAAEKIGNCGSQLNRLAGEIAELCPHSHTRSDLLAYLQRVALYSHQLIITAKVKSDMQVVGGEVIITGAESATSLIQAAKNLMNAVILAVKASYIASIKHRTGGENGVVSWHMAAPKKKPLVDRQQPTSTYLLQSSSSSRQSPVSTF